MGGAERRGGIDGGFSAWDFMNDKETLSFTIATPKPAEIVTFEEPRELATVTARLPRVVPAGAEGLGAVLGVLTATSAIRTRRAYYKVSFAGACLR
jgi:hypothetical protein